MKRLSVHDLESEDSLQLIFEGAFDPRTEQQRELEPFFQVLETYAGGWMPDVAEGKRRRKYTRAAIWKALEEERNENNTAVGLYRTQWPALDMTLWLKLPPRPPMLDVSLEVKPLSFFSETERCGQWVELVRAWASRYPVTHAAAHSVADGALTDSPLFGRDKQTWYRDGFDKIYEVSWLNVFGPKLVSTVGRERLLSTPAWRVEELPNGCVLLVTWPTASDFSSPEARLAQARAHSHLRPDLDFDSLLRTLLERSARLAPVQPRFHPDLAPLLSRLVDGVASHQRPRQIATFNAWQPPEPDEWAPASSALPPNVSNPEAALAYYDTLAEQLVALRHTLAPSVLQGAPESLSDLDVSFWQEDFPARHLPEVLEQHALPSIGAYLGQVLVRQLGGRWIPRQKLEESQVLVGTRVWFPFLRARHYLRSRQSLLDFSLTRFFQVAARHRC